MTNINEKAIRIVAFSGKSVDYRMWAATFMAAAHVKSYSKCLLNDLSKSEEIEKSIKEALANNEAVTDKRMAERKKVKDGLSEEDVEIVMKAYTDLMLACTDEINFDIVFNAKSWLFPDGDAYLAWVRLRTKHQPTTNSQKIMLRREFHQSRLGKFTRSPDEWIEELELIRSRLVSLGVQIEDEDLVMQILEGLPKEYDMLVTLLHARYKINDLTIESLREELNMYYDRMKSKKPGRFRSSDEANNDQDEAALITGQFKGRCRGCGKFRHKKADCPDEKSKSGTGNKKFNGKCFHCGRKGHRKANCWQLKKKENDKANAVTEGHESDSEYALVMHHQVYDVGYATSKDESINDINDWKGRLVLRTASNNTNNIIDYTDTEDEEDSPFVKIDCKSWRKRRYWEDAELSSDSDSEVSLLSSNDNKYDALCCWCIDDDDGDESMSSEGRSIDESNTVTTGAGRVDAIELRSVSETEKAEEADNLLSYEEQVQLEQDEREVHTIFYDEESDETPSQMNSNTTIDYVMELESNVREQLLNQSGDADSEAFDFVPLETPPEINMLYDSLVEANEHGFLRRQTFGVNGFGSVLEDSDSYNSISDDDDSYDGHDDHSEDDPNDDDAVGIGLNEVNEQNTTEPSPTSSDDRITVIEDIEVEEEMMFAEDASTDNEFLTEEECRQAIERFRIIQMSQAAEPDSDGHTNLMMMLRKP